MSSQFQMAVKALSNKNTKNFNTKYGRSNVGKRHLAKRIPSQFELAREAILSRSPELFNEQMSNTSSRPGSPVSFGGAGTPVKTPPKKSKTRKVRRAAMTYKNAEKIKMALGKPPLHPKTRKQLQIKPHKVVYMNNINLDNISFMSEAQMNKMLKSFS